MYVRIDRTRKVPITTFLRALGLSSDEDIYEVFGENDYLVNTIEKDSTRNTDEALIEIYEKLRPGEPATLDSSKNQLVTRFFDRFRYDLAKVGRYKFNKKLNVLDRLLGCTLAEDIKNENNEVVVSKGTVVTKEIKETLRPLFENGGHLKKTIINEELDNYDKIEEVLVYDKENPEKIIKIIGNDPATDVRRLTIPDVYASVSYYLNLHDNIGYTDEIDNCFL